jgi:hypothetical protein
MLVRDHQFLIIWADLYVAVCHNVMFFFAINPYLYVASFSMLLSRCRCLRLTKQKHVFLETGMGKIVFDVFE